MGKKKAVELSDETKRAVEEGDRIREELTGGTQPKKAVRHASKKSSSTDEETESQKASREAREGLKK